MTQTQHFTTAATWTVPANITRARAVVAGEQGLPYTGPYGVGGSGAIVAGIRAVSGSVAVGVGAIPGGAASGGISQRGGRASVVLDIVGAGGGGVGQEVIRSDPATQRGGGGNGGRPGQPGLDGGSGRNLGQGGGGGADGSGGAAGTASGGTATAGQSHASGGAGGAGKGYGSGYGGGGGGGFGGGGGGAVDYDSSGPAYLGAQGGGGSSSGDEFVGYNDGAPYVDLFWASAPLAPTLLVPVSSAPINRATAQTFSWRHNGASTDELDRQAAYELQYRLIGAPSWTTVAKTVTADQSHTFDALTFAAGDYEWQVRTYADGLVGAWSPSGFFTAADLPPSPIITSPADTSTVQTVAIPITWSSAGQVEYQARVITGTTVLADTGAVTSAAMTASLNVTANHIGAHVQVRIRNSAGGLWSDYADVSVSIEWVGPPAPVVILRPDPARGRIGIEWTQTTGTAAVDHYDVDAVENGSVFSIARALAAESRSAFHYLPLSDVDTTIQVTAVAANGAYTIGEAR